MILHFTLRTTQTVINSRHPNGISGISTSQLKHIWIQNTIFKQNQQSMCFWGKSRGYLGTSAYVLMGLSRGAAAATTTTVSVYFRRKHFAARSRGIRIWNVPNSARRRRLGTQKCVDRCWPGQEKKNSEESFSSQHLKRLLVHFSISIRLTISVFCLLVIFSNLLYWKR